MQRFEKIYSQLHILKRHSLIKRCYSSEKTPENSESNGDMIKLSGFAKAFVKHENLLNKSEQNPKEIRTFAYLVRHSKFIDLGDPEGKIVTGKIYHTAGTDLYIDFGWKFNCVCQKPIKNADGYVRDAIVRLKIKDLELSTKFLGAEKDLTLLEADCILLGLVSTPFGSQTDEKSKTVS